MASGGVQPNELPAVDSASRDIGHCHGGEIRPTGSGGYFGGIASGLCGRRQGPGAVGTMRALVPCASKRCFAPHHHAGAVFGLSAGRNRRGGSDLLLSGTGQPGDLRHYLQRLSADPGLCTVDCSDLYGGQSGGGSLL